MTPFLGLALNNAYANRTLFGALTGMTTKTFTAPRPGFFPTLARTLNHIYEVDLFYVDALCEEGRGRSVYDRPDIDDVATLAEAQAAVDLRLATFSRDVSETDRIVEVERKHGKTEETVSALLLHLFQHQIHHRGQAHVQLSDVGLAPPQLDEFFLEFDRAPIAQEYFA